MPVAKGDRFPSEDDQRQAIRDVAARISTVDPGSAVDVKHQAFIANRFDNDPAKAAPLFERALELDPGNPELLLTVTFFLRDIGRIEDAVTTAEYLALRDPTCIYCLYAVSNANRTAGEYDRAIEILQDAVAWSPNREGIHWALGSALLQAGRPEEALAEFEKQKDGGMVSFARVFALYDLGRMQEFEEEFARLRSSDSDRSPEGIARIYAWTGNNDLALESLEKMVALEGPERLTAISTGGFYKKLASDPRFDALLRKHGRHPDQHEAIPFRFTPPGGKPGTKSVSILFGTQTPQRVARRHRLSCRCLAADSDTRFAVSDFRAGRDIDSYRRHSVGDRLHSRAGPGMGI